MLAPNGQDPCGHGIGCALLPWCASARRLRAAVSRSPALAAARIDLLLVIGKQEDGALAQSGRARRTHPQHSPADRVCLLSNSTEELDERDCPGVRLIHASTQLRRAVQLHVDRVVASGVMSYNPTYMHRMGKVLYKWELMRQTEYDAIVFADLDVDLMPAFGGSGESSEEVGREWAARLPELVGAARHPTLPFHLLGYGDLTSPWVAGLFWVFPPVEGPALYWEGVRVLRAPWNATHGFNRSGTPHELWGRSTVRFADGTAGGPLLHRHIFGAGWQNIDGGDLEQGLVLHMLWHRSPQRGVFVNPRRRPAHRPAHYVRSPRKPWLRALSYKAVPEGSCEYEDKMRHYYLAQLARLPLVQSPTTACAQGYEKAWEELRTRLKCDAAQIGGPGGHDRLSIF